MFRCFECNLLYSKKNTSDDFLFKSYNAIYLFGSEGKCNCCVQKGGFLGIKKAAVFRQRLTLLKTREEYYL